MLSLFKWAPVVDAVTLEAPQLRLTHLGEGRYDLDDVLARLATAPGTPAADSDSMRFALYNLVLVDGAIDFTDVPHQRTHQLSQRMIKLPFLSNLPAQRDVLNQLKFGDAVPDAKNSLPVKLAVALLADRQGVIDLPVSGSLSDPQFRLGPIMFKLIVNLIVKAVTAPFSLLANVLGGGGEELSVVNFAAGSAALSPDARAGLDKVAKALQERPALTMTVVGSASLPHEREAYKRAQLQALVLAEKRRGGVLNGATADLAQTLAVSEQDYPVSLKAVYRRIDFPKPRNLMGLTKDISVPEMEALLLANLSATETAMQVLAEQRGLAVRDYLASLKLPMARLFLGASKAVPEDGKWQPRAELHLATQ